MRAPLSLLRRFVPIPEDFDTFVLRMNTRVSEVEHVHRYPTREQFAGVEVVELAEVVERREGHGRWRLTDGRHIVVGDRFEVGAGERYAAVLAGGRLPDGTEVEARSVAGQPSDGALMSEAMLGVGKEAARPLRLAPDTAVGADAWSALELDDVVLEFDLEPNRPDLFSLAGIARDIAAIWGLPYTSPTGLDLADLPPLSSPTIDLATPRARAYLALAMRGVRVGPSPQWLQNAVRKLGMRPINAVVDAANLCMMELGEPTHTFDRARLRGDAIVLRMATDGETITTLDGVSRALTAECLLVCDGADRPVAVAGVMGDASTEVGADTTELLVEVAAFDMAAVRRASRRLALRTEASARFEKGLPVGGIAPAAARLAWLLREVTGAEPVAMTRAGAPAVERFPIRLDRATIRGRLGMTVDDASIDRILVAAGCVVGEDEVLAPEFRPDLRIPADLVEEIGRVHGYEHVVPTSLRVELASPRGNPRFSVPRAARGVLTAAGFDEVYLPVWIGDAEVERYAYAREGLVTLANPLTEELRYFRPSSLPHLVEAAVENRKELERFAYFEVGRTYTRLPDGALAERLHLGALASSLDVREARELLLTLGRALGASLDVDRDAHPHLHPGRTLRVGAWAVAGELHPRIAREAGLREAPTVLLVDLEAVLDARPPQVRYVPPPRFPGITLDLNVTVPLRVEAAAVLDVVPTLPDLATATVVDVWPMDSGARLTLRLSFNAKDRSLTADEIAPRVERVRAAMTAAGWGA